MQEEVGANVFLCDNCTSSCAILPVTRIRKALPLEGLRSAQNIIRIRYRDIYHDKDFVFAKLYKTRGYPEYIKTLENRMCRLLKLAGLNESLTPHSLRHTHVSLLAEAGVELHDIMDRLGHKDDDTTRNVYMHVTKVKKKEAAQKFSELMNSF